MKKRKKKINLTPFDRTREPPRQNLLLMPPVWLWCWLSTRSGRLTIRRVGMEGLKPPFLVLATHHAFMDFYVTPLCLFPHRANYVSELEGFENYGEWPYRQVGCLGTRKYINDVALVRNIRRCMDRGGILVLYPEARYANVGTSSQLPPSTAKLIRYLKVPVVTINMRGNYLQSPIWNLKKRGGVHLEAEARLLLTAEEAGTLPLEELQERVQEALTYDEYAWQLQTGTVIDAPWRAEGLEHPLYQCAACGAEFHMASQGAELFCTACGARWRMTELGRLEGVGDTPSYFPHIPDWYEWERRQVEEAIAWGAYEADFRVRVQALPNAVNFVELGEGRLHHGPEGFTLTFTDYGGAERTLRFSARSTFSLHTEYDYRGQGECVTLSTPDNTYFLYPLEEGFRATKLQFATESLWRRAQKKAAGKAPV